MMATNVDWPAMKILLCTVFAEISDFLFIVSLTLLMSALGLIVWTLVYSLKIGDWPFSYGYDWPMNHGPWRYTFSFLPNPRRDALENVFLLLPSAVALSFFSLILSPGKKALALFLICLGAIYLSFDQLYWLID